MKLLILLTARYCTSLRRRPLERCEHVTSVSEANQRGHACPSFQMEIHSAASHAALSLLNAQVTAAFQRKYHILSHIMAGGLVKYRHLGRKSSHRRALLRNLVTSLIEHESISTTWHKAKEAQRLAEKMITLGKKNTEASRRQALKFLFVRTHPSASRPPDIFPF